MNTNINQNRAEEFSILTTLEKDQRYTIATMNEFGIGINAIQITLDNVTVSPYAQYSESVQLIFKIKGTRKLRGLRFHGSKFFGIWQGWHEIKNEAFSAPTISNGLVCKKSLYLSFDKQYLIDAINSTVVTPLFTNIIY
jgi:hypothetical protein